MRGRMADDIQVHTTGGYGKSITTKHSVAHILAAQATLTALPSYYVGLNLNATTQQYDWMDGINIGNGAISNLNPYAHW
jgi:hypothetical protein